MASSMQELIRQVIANFDEQQTAYRWVLKLAGEQLEMLSNDQDRVLFGINEILSKRQALMQEISQMNLTGQALQTSICKELDINEFCLSNLEDKLDRKDFEDLQQVLTVVGDVLAEISRVDNASHKIMSHSVVGSRGKKINPDEAALAYKNARQNIPEN